MVMCLCSVLILRFPPTIKPHSIGTPFFAIDCMEFVQTRQFGGYYQNCVRFRRPLHCPSFRFSVPPTHGSQDRTFFGSLGKEAIKCLRDRGETCSTRSMQCTAVTSDR